MIENFRSRMGDLRQEMDRLANQAEELERIVQEQQVRLEEMDLLVRQRDEQLAEQQARVEELEAILRQREEEAQTLQSRLSASERALEGKESEVESLRAQLAEREATEIALRQELARVGERAAPEAVAVPLQTWMERFAVLEGLVGEQREAISALRVLVQEEMAGLHNRLQGIETRLAMPPAAPVAVEAEPPAVVLPPAAAIADPLQAALYQALEMLPAASLVGLAGQDGLGVELASRQEHTFASPLEVELAELAAEAARVAAALGTGSLLTLAFQVGEEHCLLSPVGESHFAFLLTVADSPAEFRRAQAVLLQTASQLSDL